MLLLERCLRKNIDIRLLKDDQRVADKKRNSNHSVMNKCAGKTDDSVGEKENLMIQCHDVSSLLCAFLAPLDSYLSIIIVRIRSHEMILSVKYYQRTMTNQSVSDSPRQSDDGQVTGIHRRPYSNSTQIIILEIISPLIATVP